MTKRAFDWESVDTSDWGKVPDTEIAKRYNVHQSVIAYWRGKFGILSFYDERDNQAEEMFAKGFQKCSRCQEYIPVANFNKAKDKRFGLHSECKDCRKILRERDREKSLEKKKRYYLENKEYFLEKNAKWREENYESYRAMGKNRVRRLKEKYIALTGGCCQRCGYNEFYNSLCFHHVDPQEKEATPSKEINSGDEQKALIEIDKCCLLCFNCHQSFHGNAWDAEFIKRDGVGWTIKR
jgi:hypothetical protein